MKFTPSMLECFSECQKKFYWRYIRNLMKAGLQVDAFAFGTSCHNGFQGAEDDGTLAYSLGALTFKHCGDSAEVFEAEGERAYGDLIFAARTDGFHPNFVREIKTTSRACVDYLNAASLTIQNVMLGMVFDKPVKLTVIKKPTIRIRKDESDADFKTRAMEIYRSSEDWLAVCDLPSPTDSDKREVYSLAAACMFAMHQPDYTFVRNCKACYTFRACEYLDLCSDYESFHVAYVQRPEEHRRNHGHEED